MSTPEFDKSQVDADRMFDFLEEEAANRPASENKVRQSNEFVMPIIRKPVPISESGAARADLSAQVFTEAASDDDFDFLSDDDSSSVKTATPQVREEAWNEGVHVIEKSETSSRFNWLWASLGLFIIGGAALAFWFVGAPATNAPDPVASNDVTVESDNVSSNSTDSNSTVVDSVVVNGCRRPA